MYASNAARFEQAYRDIADVIKIAGREDPGANIFKLVHDWLRGCGGTWLMILDNVDDADFFVNAQAPIQSQSSDCRTLRPLRDYLPQSQNGSILITTRSQESALKLSEWNDLIRVDSMTPSNAVELLEKKLESTEQRNDEDYVELAAALEFMPLAIVQAAAYISQGESRCSVQQYLTEFRKSDRRKTSLLDLEGGQLRRDGEAKNSIIITWQISFDYIHRTRPSAADLLSLMSFFDRQGIPESLVRDRAQAENGPGSREEPYSGDGQGNSNEDDSDIDSDSDSISESDKDNEFEKDVRILRDYSFISYDTNQTFEMHSLVQLATRKWLKANGQLEVWKQCYTKNLSAKFPTEEHENWIECQALFPHVKSAVTQRPKGEESLREWASLLHNAARYSWRKWSITEAVDLSEIAMKIRKKILGQEHKETLASMGMLSLAYGLGGRWKEAEELQVRVMETTKRLLGEEHPSTLTSMNNLATMLSRQGKYEEAERIHRQALPLIERVLGKEHPSTLTSMNNLAEVLSRQGKYEEAERIHRQALSLRERVLGKKHLSTLTSMNNLAEMLSRQGKYEEAERIHRQALSLRERMLRKEHPDTLTSMNNLAVILSRQGKYEEAEGIHRLELTLTERVLGKEHPYTLTSMNNLASVLGMQGKYEEAKRIHQQALSLRERVLGKEHPSTLTSMNNLAEMLRNQGKYEEAERIHRQALILTERVLGKKHPDTLGSMNNLASVLSNQGKYEEAERIHRQTLLLIETVLGKEHPSTLTSMNNLALVLSRQGKYDEAERLSTSSCTIKHGQD